MHQNFPLIVSYQVFLVLISCHHSLETSYTRPPIPKPQTRHKTLGLQGKPDLPKSWILLSKTSCSISFLRHIPKCTCSCSVVFCFPQKSAVWNKISPVETVKGNSKIVPRMPAIERYVCVYDCRKILPFCGTVVQNICIFVTYVCKMYKMYKSFSFF